VKYSIKRRIFQNIITKPVEFLIVENSSEISLIGE